MSNEICRGLKRWCLSQVCLTKTGFYGHIKCCHLSLNYYVCLVQTVTKSRNHMLDAYKLFNCLVELLAKRFLFLQHYVHTITLFCRWTFWFLRLLIDVWWTTRNSTKKIVPVRCLISLQTSSFGAVHVLLVYRQAQSST